MPSPLVPSTVSFVSTGLSHSLHCHKYQLSQSRYRSRSSHGQSLRIRSPTPAQGVEATRGTQMVTSTMKTDARSSSLIQAIATGKVLSRILDGVLQLRVEGVVFAPKDRGGEEDEPWTNLPHLTMRRHCCPWPRSRGQRQVPLVRRKEITNVGGPVKPVGQCARLYLCRLCVLASPLPHLAAVRPDLPWG